MLAVNMIKVGGYLNKATAKIMASYVAKQGAE